MLNIEVGQVLEFIAPAHIDGQEIAKGTKVRVGFVQSGLLESMVMVVILGDGAPRTVQMPRHVLTLHARPAPSQQ
jgi:hypothetical protein